MESLKIKTNPWEVENLDEYLNYCCPECDHKSKTKGLFINHAFSSHPEAKDNLKYEECSEEIIIKSDITIKEEYIEDYFLQLGAYSLAHNAVYNSRIAQGVILICTVNNLFQDFKIEGDQLTHYQNRFLEKVEQFYRQLETN
jgi:hypothetical protein